MRKGTRLHISTSVLVIMIGAIFFAGKPQPSSAQVDGFELYYLNVHCGNSGLPSATFTHRVTEGGTVGRPLQGTWTICVGNYCPDGAFTLADELAKLPAKVSAALQAEVDTHQANAAAGKGSRLRCLGPKEPLPPGCVMRDFSSYGGPWFDPGAQGCQNLQDTLENATWSPDRGGTCTYTLRACRYVAATQKVNILYFKDGKKEDTEYGNLTPEELAEYGVTSRPIRRNECNLAIFDEPKLRVPPQKVCCDIWQEAVRAGSDCNPEKDADCDGLPNDKDASLSNSVPYYAPLGAKEYDGSFNFTTDPKDFNPADFDPRPPGLGWDEVMPNEPCKECKWLALSGKLTCSPDKNKRMPESRKRDHEYKVTWKCPTSGVQRVVTKRVAARFPCTPPKRPTPAPTPSAPTLRPTLSQIFGSGLLTNPSMAVLPGFWTRPCVGSQLESNL